MTTPSANRSDGADASTTERARSLSEQASATVRQAADVLEQELSAGLDEARRLQRKLTDQRRIEPGDLDEVSARVRGNAHLLIDMVSDRFGDLGGQEVQELGQRFAKDAHGAFDALLDLVQATPDLVNRLVDRAGSATAADGRTRPAPDPESGPHPDPDPSPGEPPGARGGGTTTSVRAARTATAPKTARAPGATKTAKTAKTAKAPGPTTRARATKAVRAPGATPTPSGTGA